MARKYWRQEQVAKIIVRIRKQEQDQNPEMSIAFTAMPQWPPSTSKTSLPQTCTASHRVATPCVKHEPSVSMQIQIPDSPTILRLFLGKLLDMLQKSEVCKLLCLPVCTSVSMYIHFENAVLGILRSDFILYWCFYITILVIVTVLKCGTLFC